MTTTKPSYKRFTRRADSGVVPNTQSLGAQAYVEAALAAAPWKQADEQRAYLTVNNPSAPDFSGQQYDAFRQSGAAVADTGTQVVFGGMAAYRIPVPPEAATTNIAKIDFRMSADKFCVGGLRVAAVLSDEAEPPTDAALLRAGGANGIPDTTGKFATATDLAGNGVLAETEALVSNSRNRTGEFTLDLSGELGSYSYVYLIVQLHNFTVQRREYWVEGSGAIDGASIAVTFSGDITIPDPPVPPVPVVMAARQVGASTRVRFSGTNYNLESGYLRLHWGARMLLAGFADPVTGVSAAPTTLSQHMRLAPRAQISGFDSVARGEYAEAYTAEPLLAGSTLWIRATEAPEGAARIRVSVLDQTDVPDVTAPSVWDGSAANCIGTALVHPAAGEWVGVPLVKNASTRYVVIVAAVAEVPPEDAAFISVGFANAGLDLTDMHVASAVAVPAVPVLPAYGILTLKPDTLVEGDIFGAVRSGLTIADPITDRGNVGLTSAASACWLGTSYGEWTTLLGGAADAVAQSSDLAIWSGNGFFLAQDTRQARWLKSGALPAALATLSAPTTRAFINRIVVEGGAVAWVDAAAAAGCKTAGEAGAWKTEMDAWTNVMVLAKAGQITIGIASAGGGGTTTRAYVSQDGAGVKTAIEAITNAYDVVIDYAGPYHRIIFRLMDGTVRAFSRLLNAALVEDTAVSAWTGVTDVGIADGQFWAISGNTLLCSGAAPSWADDSALPASAQRKILISGGGRLGLAYTGG